MLTEKTELQSKLLDKTNTPTRIEKISTEASFPLITENARNLLTDWGFSDSTIEELGNTVNCYRYDHCLEKIRRIKNIYLHDLEDDGKQIVIPHGLDLMGKRRGQCGDLSAQLLLELKYRDFLKTSHNTSLKLNLSAGLSRTFFQRDGCKHYWLTLTEAEEVKTIDPKRSIIIDPSFQEIIELEESQYDIKSMNAHLEFMRLAGAAAIEVNSIEFTSGKKKGFLESSDAYLLGLSDTREYLYSLGFAEQSIVHQGRINNTGLLKAFILVSHSNGFDSCEYYFGLNSEELIQDTNNASVFTAVDRDEIRSLLEEANKIKIHDYKTIYREPRRKTRLETNSHTKKEIELDIERDDPEQIYMTLRW